MAKARIVIVNYNGADFVHAAISSALAQEPGCEVVVVDNGSRDGSREEIASRYPNVRMLRNQENVGFGRAANAGALLEPRSHDYVAFLNSDAVARPQWIFTLTQWMQSSYVDVASSVVSGGAQPFFVGGRWRPFIGTAFKLSSYAGVRSEWISGCAMVVRSETFELLRGFDERYFMYYEDVDLSLRASRLGMRLGVYGDALVRHPEEGRSINPLGTLQKRRLGLVSKGRIVRHFVPWYALPTALAFQCVLSPAINGASVAQYPALLSAFFEGFLPYPGAFPGNRVASKP